MNIQKVNELPIHCNNIGKSWDTRKTAAHNENSEIDMALPLVLLGKISAITTKVNGPSEIAKNAM